MTVSGNQDGGTSRAPMHPRLGPLPSSLRHVEPQEGLLGGNTLETTDGIDYLLNSSFDLDVEPAVDAKLGDEPLFSLTPLRDMRASLAAEADAPTATQDLESTSPLPTEDIGPGIRELVNGPVSGLSPRGANTDGHGLATNDRPPLFGNRLMAKAGHFLRLVCVLRSRLMGRPARPPLQKPRRWRFLPRTHRAIVLPWALHPARVHPNRT